MRHPVSWYTEGRTIRVRDKMQDGYTYTLRRKYGDMSDHPEFMPQLTPPEMLRLGVFEGKYLNDCVHEFPKEWFTGARVRPDPLGPDPSVNCFGVKSRQPLSEWQRKHWILGKDVRGWFQWYCRFYIGRREDLTDKKQIARWKSFRRHVAQVQKHCRRGDTECRPRQRQALLQWAYDPFI